MHPFPLTLVLLLLIHAASTAGRSCNRTSPIHYRKTASKSTLAVSSNRSEHHALHRCEPQSFQMNFRRSQIIFPWCKVMEQLPLFSESVGGRFANTGSAYLRQNLPFSDTHKKEYSGINYLLPSYPIKNIRIFLFLQAQKSIRTFFHGYHRVCSLLKHRKND
jgi:hypothetical protein